KGIVHNDPDFAITSVRQREHRKLWAADDGYIYVAYAKSTWCDSGICPTSSVTDPGALRLLRFKLGGRVEEVTVSKEAHYYIGGVREEAGSLYVWAGTTIPWRVYEYVSHDGARTWSRTALHEGACNRLHGQTRIQRLESSVRMAFTCSG